MKIVSDITINAPARQVWQVVAHEFASIGEWASGVTQSRINTSVSIPEGAHVGGRVCNVPGFGEIHETFIAYDDEAMKFTYVAEGMPFFVISAHNGWTAEALDANTTRVRFHAEMRLLPIIGSLMAIPMRMQLVRLLREATEELKYYVETGELHPRKRQQIQTASRATATR